MINVLQIDNETMKIGIVFENILQLFYCHRIYLTQSIEILENKKIKLLQGNHFVFCHEIKKLKIFLQYSIVNR